MESGIHISISLSLHRFHGGGKISDSERSMKMCEKNKTTKTKAAVWKKYSQRVPPGDIHGQVRREEADSK